MFENELKPTKVIVFLPKLNGDGMTPNFWIKGQPRLNPEGKHDKVTDIGLIGVGIAEITYEKFGQEWIYNISSVEFKNVSTGEAKGEGDI